MTRLKHLTKRISIGALALAFLLPGTALAIVPSDPDVTQWSYTDTKLFEAWDGATGSREVVVAVIDNGFDTFHPDIFPNVWTNDDEIQDNGIDDDNNGYIDDYYGWDFAGVDENGDGRFSADELEGDNDPRPDVTRYGSLQDEIHHGTLVAGIIGAVGNNNRNSAGINWNVRLMNLKVIHTGGRGDLFPVSLAIRYAADNGADVINMSLVGDVSEDIKSAVKYAYDKGVAVVAAAGNSRVALNISQVYPVCADAGESEQWILGVSAIKRDHFIADFSNTGSDCIDITAPGTEIFSTQRYAPRFTLAEPYGGPWQGTSFAAPFVAGTAALVKSIQPGWSPKQIYDAILSTVHRTPPTNVEAYENLYGAGLLQVNNAVEFALSQTPTVRPGNGFAVASLNTGQLDQFTNNSTSAITGEHSALVRVGDVVALPEGGYATFRHISGEVGEVVIYGPEWTLKDHWTVKSFGNMQIKAADVTGDGNTNIILSPLYSNTLLFRTYSLSGRQVSEVRSSSRHASSYIDTRSAGGTNQIVVIYNNANGLQLENYDGAGSLVGSLNISAQVKQAGPIVVADINGDGAEEYAVASPAGAVPKLSYFDVTGRWLRTFSTYAGSYLGGVDLAAVDYNQDGFVDIVTVPRAGGQKVRVWSDKSRKVFQTDITGTNLHVVVPRK